MLKKIVFFCFVFLVLSCSSEDNNSETNDPEVESISATISAITNISNTSATVNVTIQGITIDMKGLVWDTSTGPTVENNDLLNQGDGGGNFTAVISNLAKNTVYFVRPYVTNDIGIFYGEELSFATANTCEPEKIYQGDVNLNSQTDVNSFGLESFCEINGTLRIEDESPSDPITDLSPLSQLNRIIDNLEIGGNDGLVSLEGLNNLEFVGDGLGIARNINLLNIDALGNLSSVGEIRVTENNNLLNIDGFENISNLSSESNNRGLDIASNIKLKNINGLQNLTYINGFVWIRNNQVLENIDGLGSLVTVDTGELTIENNLQLNNLQGLSNLKFVQRGITINNNSLLLNLDGMQNIEFLAETTTISNNQQLNSLDGFPNSGGIRGLAISNNNSLTDISALGSLVDGVTSITINDNNILQNINGLGNLESINIFIINNNSNIENLDDLQNLTLVTGLLSVGNNNQLGDFCGITNLVISGGLQEADYFVFDNLYNPTLQDIIDGNCSQ